VIPALKATSTLEAEERKHEARRQGGKHQQARDRVEQCDPALPEGGREAVGARAHVGDVEEQHAEEESELRPLGRVADEQPDVFRRERAHRVGERCEKLGQPVAAVVRRVRFRPPRRPGEARPSLMKERLRSLTPEPGEKERVGEKQQQVVGHVSRAPSSPGQETVGKPRTRKQRTGRLVGEPQHGGEIGDLPEMHVRKLAPEEDERRPKRYYCRGAEHNPGKPGQEAHHEDGQGCADGCGDRHERDEQYRRPGVELPPRVANEAVGKHDRRPQVGGRPRTEGDDLEEALQVKRAKGEWADEQEGEFGGAVERRMGEECIRENQQHEEDEREDGKHPGREQLDEAEVRRAEETGAEAVERGKPGL
jgi:hypothetical protein